MGVCAAAALAACGFDPSSAGGAGGGDGASDASPGAADAAPGAPDGGRPPRDAGPGDGDAGAAPGRQKAITIPAGRVGENLDGFPLYVELVDDTELAARAAADGSDIHFRTQNGTPLAHEIQRWDPASGRLEAWVRVSLSAGASTVILLRYGDPAASVPENPAGVWQSGFAAVWHLEETPAGPGSIVDSRGDHPGTSHGAMTPGDLVPARLGRGIDFDGNDDVIEFSNPLPGSGTHTISAWVRQEASNSNDALVVLGNGVCDQARWLHSRFSQGTVAYGFYCDDNLDSGEDIQGDGFTLLHWTYDDGAVSRLYRDGVQVGDPFDHEGEQSTVGDRGRIGNAPGRFGPNMGLNAVVDEVRISAVARSAAWIAAEHANQSSPGTFYTIGLEQPAAP